MYHCDDIVVLVVIGGGTEVPTLEYFSVNLKNILGTKTR